MMRLDKFLGETGTLTRSEASKAARGGRVKVNGIPEKNPAAKINEEQDIIELDGRAIEWRRFRYIMLNKPSGWVSTTEERENSVMKLLPPQYSRMDMFPCGRLDIDTTGLLIITNDGQTAHNLLSPKNHCEKTYSFTCLPLTEEMKNRLENGVELKDFTSKPCRIELTSPAEGKITVTEGKYHQIKRMFLSVGSEITRLERITFAGIELDKNLPRGQWRELDMEEVRLLLTYAK